MFQFKLCGLAVEVLAVATLLQTNYHHLHSLHRDFQEVAVPYKLLFPVTGTNLREEKIYLRNRCQHFERVIRAL